MRSPLLALFSAFACLVPLLASTTAEARGHCWCEIANACPKDGGRTAHDLGAIASYSRFESGKELDCSTRCAHAAADLEAQLRDDPAALCEKLGPGTHRLAAYSKVGHTDTRRKWCDPDHIIGTLACERECICPEGFEYDPGAGHCAGRCGDLFVMTRPDSCHWDGAFTDGDPCDGVTIGPMPVGIWPVELMTPEGELVWVEDVVGDLHVEEIPAELPLDALEDAPDGPPVCGVDICEGG